VGNEVIEIGLEVQIRASPTAGWFQKTTQLERSNGRRRVVAQVLGRFGRGQVR
jgi:hypothetical protein